MPAISAPHNLRVVHFASGDLWGGAEAVVYSLIREQLRRHPDSVACVLMNRGQLADRLTALGIPLLVLDESRQGLRELLRHAGAFVNSLGADVLHAHRRKENLLAWLIAIRHGRARRLARVTSIHGMPEPLPKGMSLRRRITEFVNDITLSRGFDAIVAVSHDIEQRMRSKFGHARVVCIHNGIESHAAATRTDVSGRPLRLLALGRLVPIKRFDRLRTIADALAALGTRTVITLAGEGPLMQALERELRSDDPAAGIRMVGFVAQPAALFDDADGLLITSDHEGIPMVALEALSRGIPVFGFAVGGLPEIAATNVPMHLVAPGDSEALARVIRDHFAGRGIGRDLRPPADWKFSIEHCASEYERLYASVAGGSTDSRQA